MNRKRLILAGGLAALLLAAAAAALLARRQRPAAPAGEAGEAVTRHLEVADEPPVVAFWLDVHEPAKLWKSIAANAWLQKALSEPLGEGFLAGWAGLLGSRGEDLGSAFQGAVGRLATEELLAQPFRVVWFSGSAATGVPAAVVPDPSGSARAALGALVAIRRGEVIAAHCPGARPAPGEEAKAQVTLQRLLIAEQAVYAAVAEDRLVLSRHPMPALQGLCVAAPRIVRAKGVDLDLGLSREGLGREAQLLGELVGLGSAPRLSFAIEGDRLLPRGIEGDLAAPSRLDTSAIPEGLLKLAPEDAGVVVTLALRLPARLTRDALKAHFSGADAGPLATRSALLLWNPRGAAGAPTEVALAWSRPDDRPGLREAFSGPNRLKERTLCGALVLASTDALLARMQRTCEGKSPSLLDGPAPVAAGLRAPASVGLGLNLGRLLPALLGDAYAADVAKGEAPRTPPTEIEAARRVLEELPFIGLRGVARDKALVPGGYRS